MYLFIYLLAQYCGSMLPQYCANYNDVFLLTVSTKNNFGQARYRLLDDGLYGPKHVAVTAKKCFNVNFNILYVK
jgi:hypothetical protein